MPESHYELERREEQRILAGMDARDALKERQERAQQMAREIMRLVFAPGSTSKELEAGIAAYLLEKGV